jgi:hypothetical protein
MKVIDKPLNPELLKIVDTYAEWFFSQDRSKINIGGTPDENEYHTSKEYLDSINKEKHIGFPEVTYGIDLTLVESTPRSFREKIIDVDTKLNNFFGAKFCAVKMYYPNGGYMGWHTNWNCHGYNILLSYNKDGNGYFRYRDPITEQIVTQEDKKGWQAKVGYFGKREEPDKITWHCARSRSERLTFGYVIPDESMWQMMVDDL